MAVEQLKQVPSEHRAAVLKMLMVKILGGQAESDDSAASAAIISRIAGTLEPNERYRLAEAMAHSRHTPPTLIHEFARDEVFVAEPVLRWSHLINGEFLEKAVQDLSDAHLSVVSRRADLSATMAEILIGHGSAEVHCNVALNPSVPLSKKMIIELMKSAADHPGIEEALCGRKDLPIDFFGALIGRVGERLRAKVGSRAEALEPASLQLAMRTVDIEKGVQQTEMHGLSMADFVKIAELAKWEGINEQRLVEFITKRDVGAAIACFGYLVGVDQHVSRGLICRSAGESLAVVARAADMDRGTFKTLACFRVEMKLTETSASKQLEMYDSIPLETAQRVMAFHAARRSKSAVG